MKIYNNFNNISFRARLADDITTKESIKNEISSNKSNGRYEIYHVIQELKNVKSNDLISIEVGDDFASIKNLNTGGKINLSANGKKYKFGRYKYNLFEGLSLLIQSGKTSSISKNSELDELHKYNKILFGDGVVYDKKSVLSASQMNKEFDKNSKIEENFDKIGVLWKKYEKKRNELNNIIEDINQENDVIYNKSQDYLISLLG